MIGRLHVITDAHLQTRFDHVELARLALEGGADVIQYREKRAIPDKVRLRTAEAMKRACEGFGATLIIDDRADIAHLVGAGVHLGPKDLPIDRVRGWIEGPVGATANDVVRAMDPAIVPATYLGVGPVYGTQSKGADPPPRMGVPVFSEICAAVSQPVIAIGGIRVERVAEVLAAGAHGIAVLGAVVFADDPEAATFALRRALEAA